MVSDERQADVELPIGLSLETANEAAKLVRDWEENEGAFVDATGPTSLVFALWRIFFEAQAGAAQGSTCTPRGGC